MSDERTLVLGAGRTWRRWRGKTGGNVVCVDRGYERSAVKVGVKLVCQDLIDYLEAYDSEPFGRVEAHRVFEHLTPDMVQFALWLLWNVTESSCHLEIVVPNHKLIMERLGAEDSLGGPADEFNRMFNFAHYEVFNTPDDPHRSIWAPNLVPHYVESEGLWTVMNVERNYEKEPGRDFFLKIVATRNKSKEEGCAE